MSGENFDIFISYRRSDGTDKARMITETLKGKNYRCFLDFDRLKGGKFDEKIEIAIKDAPIFIAVMTPDYLVRQKKDKEEENQNEDWVYKEIEFAKENGKYIITINYNKQIESIPNEVPANISQALGAHTFAEVHDGQTYESNMENLIKGWISEVLPPPSFRSKEKANIEVFSDCDCNILKANEVIATVSKGGYNIIKLRQGRHRLICQSSQFSDIKQEQILTVNESLADDFFKIELANQVQERKKAIAQEQEAEKDAIKHRQDEEKRRQEEEKRREEKKEKRKQKRKEWWGRNKRKLLITLAVILGIAILIGVYSSDLGETETPTETATESQTINYTKFTYLQTLKGHSDYVHSVAYSPDGSRIISGSDDNTIKIWDVNIGTCLKTLEGHSNYVGSVSFSPDSIRIISGSYDKTIKIWDANMGVCIKSLYGHSGYVQSVAYSPDGSRIISGSADKTIKIWDSNTGVCIKTLKGHSFWVNSVAYSPDGIRIISGSGDETIKIWDANMETCLKTLEEHSGSVWSVAYSPDGSRIISGSDDKTIKIWDSNTGVCLKTLKGHSYSVLSVAYSSDGKYIISGSWDNTIKIWDANTGECVRTLMGHLGRVRSVAYSPDGTRIISGSMDKTIKIWGVE